MEANALYHIYNRGNNRGQIFFQRRNYLYFLEKVRRHLLMHVDILAYCLMPNHFHFLVYTKDDLREKAFGNDLKVMLRSYTRAINKQENRTGSLFQQHTKVKPLDGGGDSHTMTQSHSMTSSSDYPFVCFHYIHQNPLRAGLVKRMEEYEMSSFREYAGFGQENLCNQPLAVELLDLPAHTKEFLSQSYQVQIIGDTVK